MKADRLSKLTKSPTESDAWVVSFWVFEHYNKLWGQFDHDVFVVKTETSPIRKRSLYRVYPEQKHSNYTIQRNRNNWIVPPIQLIGDTIKQIDSTRCKGALVIPQWKSSYFWPLLFNNSEEMKTWYKEFEQHVKPKYFYQNPKGNSIFNKNFKGNVMIIRLNFTDNTF